jgi:hypothetical protein
LLTGPTGSAANFSVTSTLEQPLGNVIARDCSSAYASGLAWRRHWQHAAKEQQNKFSQLYSLVVSAGVALGGSVATAGCISQSESVFRQPAYLCNVIPLNQLAAPPDNVVLTGTDAISDGASSKSDSCREQDGVPVSETEPSDTPKPGPGTPNQVRQASRQVPKSPPPAAASYPEGSSYCVYDGASGQPVRFEKVRVIK